MHLFRQTNYQLKPILKDQTNQQNPVSNPQKDNQQKGNQQKSNYQEDNESLHKSNMSTQRITDSTLRFKLLIETLRKKKQLKNPENNHKIKDQLISITEKFNNKHFNIDSEKKTQNCKQLVQKQINQDKLLSKRNTKIKDITDQTKQTSFLSNKIWIINPQFIDKVQLNNHYKQLKESPKQQTKNLYPTITMTESNFSVLSKQNQFQNKLNQRIKVNKKIKDIQQNSVKNYLKQSVALSHNSTPQEIYIFFSNISTSHLIQIFNPFIKKYKNCIFYGKQHQQNQKYEGFLYYYQGRIYYGQFLNEHKHGHGVQIDIQNNKIWKGQFTKGRKTGKFYFKSQSEQYIGYMQNAVYNGEGKLKTNESTYEGFFNSGLKHGYGQQHFFKTGLCIKGVYKNNNFQKAQIGKIKICSQPQFKKRDALNQTSTQRVLNQRLKQKLKIIINQQPLNQDTGIINNFNFKLPKNQNNFYNKKIKGQYLSDRKSINKRSQAQELDIQNIYLEKQKFKKHFKQSFKQTAKTKQATKTKQAKRNNQRQNKSSSLSIRSNCHQEQIPLLPYFYPLNN